MNKNEQIAVAVILCWVAFMLGQQHAAKAVTVAAAAAAVPVDPYGWLNLS